jgi:hypothetical protein
MLRISRQLGQLGRDKSTNEVECDLGKMTVYEERKRFLMRTLT